MPDSERVTQLLTAWRGGSAEALDQLVPIVHHELHRLAHRALRGEGDDPLLQTTALVNEAYLKLIDQRRVDGQGRAHFFAIAASIMRRLLVDAARRRRAAKRGGGRAAVAWRDSAAGAGGATHPDLLDLEDALSQLTAEDQRAARVVELRYFAGMSFEEVATALGVSAITAKRDWQKALGWVFRALQGGQPTASLRADRA